MTFISNPTVDPATRAGRMSEINPLSSQFVPDKLADVPDGADGTYDYYVDMHGFRGLGLDFTIGTVSAATFDITIGATMQDDGTPPDDPSIDYKDVMNSIFGVTSITASDYLHDSSHNLESASSVRIQVIVSGASADAEWTIYANKIY